jgi:uncharacterized delta-60 repeat protein
MHKQRRTARALVPALLLAGVLTLGQGGVSYAAPKAPQAPITKAPTTGAGSLDPTFGTGGMVEVNAYEPGSDQARAVAILPDGKILTGGYTQNGSASAVIRYLPNGAVDPTFGNGGLASATAPDGYDEDIIDSMVVQPDGKIVTAGLAELDYTNPAYNYGFNATDTIVSRYNPDGNLDLTFGNGGQTTLDLTTYYQDVAGIKDEGRAVALDADGRIVVATSGSSEFGVARFNPDGSLDGSFGNGGVSLVSFDGQSGASNDALVIQPDGRIVTGGYYSTSEPVAQYFALVRLNPDGSLDSSFGTDNMLATLVGNGARANLHALALQPDGKIVAGGGGGGGEFALIRANSDGSLDTGFGDGGKVAEFISPAGPDFITALAVQAGGKIVAVGQGSPNGGGDSDWAAARFNPDGSLDPTFGTGGKVITTFVPLWEDVAMAAAIQPDGNIVAAGYARDPRVWSNMWWNTALVRYLGDAGAPPPPPPPPPPPAGCTVPFTDIAGNPFATYIENLYCRHIVDGYADNTFRPYSQATRGTLARWVVLSRGWALDTTGGPHFTDVPATDPLYRYVETAYRHGVLSGYADHTFRPAANVTRGQMSKMIVNAMGWAPVTPAAPHFRDVNAANPFYSQIETIYAHGLVSGYNCGAGCLEFRWGNDNTRGQLTKVLSNAVSP